MLEIASFLILAAFWKAGRDHISFRGSWFPEWKWWSQRGIVWKEKYPNPVKRFFFKYPLSFLSSGWHFCDSAMLTCFYIIIALNVEFMSFVWEVVVLYTFFGTIFTVVY